MEFKVKPPQNGLPAVFFRGSSGSTSDLLARADLLELLDDDVYRELERRSDATNEDVVVLVNDYLRRAIASEGGAVKTADHKLVNE